MSLASLSSLTVWAANACLAAVVTALVAFAVRFVLRKQNLARYLGLVERRTRQQPCVLFYAESHGELLLLAKLLPAFQERRPDAELIVMVPRSSVRKLAQEKFPKHRIDCCSPIFLSGMVAALRRLAPEMFVVVEFARVPRWARATRRLGIPLAIVNGRLNEKNQALCDRWPWVLAPIFRWLDLILVQTAADAKEFVRCGARPGTIEVVGAVKYDAAAYSRNTFATQRLVRLAGLGDADVVFLAGSTREGEEEVVASVYEQLAPEFPNLKVIVAPRNQRRFKEVAELFTERGIPFQRRSELDKTGADGQARVLLVDTVGELAAWWGSATIGFVGASLTSRGGQNMIEPAALGVATCFGPHTANFQDVVDVLTAEEAAVVVDSAAELTSFVRRCLEDPAYAANLGTRAQAACQRQTGAMQRTCDRLSDYLTQVSRAAGDSRVAASA